MQLFNYVIPQFCIKLRGYKIVNTNFFRLIYICPKIKNKFLKSTKCDSSGFTQVLIIFVFIGIYINGWGWCLFLRNQWKQIEYEFTCCTVIYWGKTDSDIYKVVSVMYWWLLLTTIHYIACDGRVPFFLKDLFIYTVCICRDGFSLRLSFRIQGPDFLSES